MRPVMRKLSISEMGGVGAMSLNHTHPVSRGLVLRTARQHSLCAGPHPRRGRLTIRGFEGRHPRGRWLWRPVQRSLHAGSLDITVPLSLRGGDTEETPDGTGGTLTADCTARRPGRKDPREK